MKIKIRKRLFEKHLESIGKAIQSNSPLPALQGIVITATESNTQILASNGNLSIKEVIGHDGSLEVIEPGKILVPGSLFKNVIKKQGQEITLNTTKNSINIESEGAKTTLQLMNVEDYPSINFDTMGKDLIVDGSAIEHLIKNVSFAAAENDKRIILNGVNLKSLNGSLTATATNSFRLAQEKVEVDSNVNFDVTILSKNLKDFIPKGIKGPLTINVNESKVITKYNSTTILSKLIDGFYPKVDGLIPKKFQSVLSIDSKTLSSLIEKATVVSDDGNKVIKLSLNDGELTIESKKREMGDSIVRTRECKWNSGDFSIALNSLFLKDAINKFHGRVAIAFNGPHDPIVIKGESNVKLTQLVLPHRTY
ncbi:MAG: DNA polymerase III subunit beta [Mycoplasmatales bacterium]|nr:DNA polymerase III subunit beta [Mycoplasmatales bacterium]